jgi:hypothetical protein
MRNTVWKPLILKKKLATFHVIQYEETVFQYMFGTNLPISTKPDGKIMQVDEFRGSKDKTLLVLVTVFVFIVCPPPNFTCKFTIY